MLKDYEKKPRKHEGYCHAVHVLKLKSTAIADFYKSNTVLITFIGHWHYAIFCELDNIICSIQKQENR